MSALATFALTAAVARMYPSQQDAGILFAATSLFLIASNLGALGTANGLVFFISGARGRRELSTVSRYMRIALPPVLVVAVLTVAVLVFCARPLGDLVGEHDGARFAQFVQIIALAIPFAAVANLALSATRGLGTMKPTAMLDQVMRPTLQLLLVVGALALAADHAVPWSWAAAYIPLAALSWLAWRRMLSTLPPQQGSILRGERVRFWKFSGARALTGVAQVSMQRLDIILVATLAGLSAAAIYTAATRFLVLGQMAARAVSQSVQPLLGELLAQGNLPGAKHLYQASTAWLILVTWPLYFTLLLFGPLVLQVFGSGYETGQNVLSVLCATMLLATACGMVDVVLVMAGKSSWSLWNALTAFAVNLGLDLLLIPSHGIVGAALGWASAILIGNLVPLAQVRFALGLHPFGRATLLACALCALCFGAVPAITSIALAGDWSGALYGCALGLVAWISALYACRHILELTVLFGALRKRSNPPRPAE